MFIPTSTLLIATALFPYLTTARTLDVRSNSNHETGIAKHWTAPDQAAFHSSALYEFLEIERLNATAPEKCDASEKYSEEQIGAEGCGGDLKGGNSLGKRQFVYTCPSGYNLCSGSSSCCPTGWACSGSFHCRRKGLTTQHIIGICFGVAIFLILIVGGVRRNRKRKAELKRNQEMGGLAGAGVVVFQNPVPGQNMDQTYPPPPMPPAYMQGPNQQQNSHGMSQQPQDYYGPPPMGPPPTGPPPTGPSPTGPPPAGQPQQPGQVWAR